MVAPLPVGADFEPLERHAKGGARIGREFYFCVLTERRDAEHHEMYPARREVPSFARLDGDIVQPTHAHHTVVVDWLCGTRCCLLLCCLLP